MAVLHSWLYTLHASTEVQKKGGGERSDGEWQWHIVILYFVSVSSLYFDMQTIGGNEITRGSQENLLLKRGTPRELLLARCTPENTRMDVYTSESDGHMHHAKSYK